MKKNIALTLKLILIMAILTVLSVGSSAADLAQSVQFAACDYDECGDNVNPALQTDSNGEALSVAIKPNDSLTAETCWYDYTVEVPVSCEKIDFVILYAATGDNRYMDVTFGDNLQHIHCPDTTDWTVFSELTVTYENIEAGSYTFKLAAPSDFDNDTIKTPNVESFVANMYAAPVVEEAPVAETPVVEAPAEIVEEAPVIAAAPQTADIVSSAVILAAAAFSAIILLNINKKQK